MNRSPEDELAEDADIKHLTPQPYRRRYRSGGMPQNDNNAHERWLSVSDFVAYSPDHSYIYRPTGEDLDVDCGQCAGDAGQVWRRQNALAANVWLDRNDAVEQRTWAPGEPQIIEDRLVAEGGFFAKRGARVFNLYKPPADHRLRSAATSGSGAIICMRCGPNEADHIEQLVCPSRAATGREDQPRAGPRR